ncbi:TetR/AcrR family transcriptional regulator [Actinoplanes sp. NPDC049596]|uniref:TetR/AcrR family transcriptional regulator n=1 Tax=unclassified Actinoplanes TaxID=2626549 RepID=UPI003412D8DD
MTGVRQQMAAQTEAELKAAAVRVFERVGYLNAKITDITAEAGRATGSFYKHFASKEQLLQALLTDLLAESDVSASMPEHKSDFADREAVRYHVVAYWEFYRRHRTVLNALQQAAIVDASFARIVDEMMEPDQHHLAEHLSGLDLPGPPLVVASMLAPLLQGFAAAWFGKIPDEDAIDTLTTFVHRGVGGA